MKRAQFAFVLLTMLVGCSPRACPKSPSEPVVCPDTASSASGLGAVDEDAVKALEERLVALRKGGRKTVRYRAPSADEERAYAAWVRDALVSATERREPPNKAPEGFSLRVMGDVWILEEARKKKRGAGAVIIRTGRAKPIFVEAPHTFFDKGTLPIALAVFDAQAARALLINTAHRYIDKPKPTEAAGSTGDEKPGENDDEKANDNDDKGVDLDDDKAPDPDENDDPDASFEIVASDVAHTERSFFLVAHRELVALVHDNVTVQLHGFRDEKVTDAGVIVSAAKSAGNADGLTQRLALALPETNVRAYPKDVKTLGGTTNVQGRASREMGAPFFHIEIARSLRDKLSEDKALRARFGAALDPLFPTNPTTKASK